jgi:hypothetical protein
MESERKIRLFVFAKIQSILSRHLTTRRPLLQWMAWDSATTVQQMLRHLVYRCVVLNKKVSYRILVNRAVLKKKIIFVEIRVKSWTTPMTYTHHRVDSTLGLRTLFGFRGYDNFLLNF